jgi:hypothetical protein
MGAAELYQWVLLPATRLSSSFLSKLSRLGFRPEQQFQFFAHKLRADRRLE